MKTLITPVALLLSAMPFAFFKMEKGARHQHSIPPHPRIATDKKVSFGKACQEDTRSRYGINYLFLYNKEKGYTIGFADLSNEQAYRSCVDFFNMCKMNLIFPETDDLSFIFVKEKKNLDMPNESITDVDDYAISIMRVTKKQIDDNIYYFFLYKPNIYNSQRLKLTGYVSEIIETDSQVKDSIKSQNSIAMEGSLLFNKNCYNNKIYNYELNEDFKKEKVKKLSKEFRSDSGVFISNKENEVTISKEGGVPRDFQKALCYYFDPHNRNIKLAQSISCFLKGETLSAQTFTKRLIDLQRTLSDEELDLLNKSNILSVFGVFKGKSGNESIIWGMAEDKDSKERFHWITDLESDISVLVQ